MRHALADCGFAAGRRWLSGTPTFATPRAVT